MLYRKNVPTLERWVRGVAALALIGYGTLVMHGVVGLVLAACGVVLIATGAFGFCPMCAMVGRRIPQPGEQTGEKAARK